MTIRLAIIGAGLMGADHARIFAEELPGSRIVTIIDADETRARTVAARHGAEAGTDAQAAISRADVDAVVIASPDVTHAKLSLAAIAAGKPVLCEKPLSQDSGECVAVIEAEVAAGRSFVQLGFMRRYDQAYVEMRQALARGALGRPLMMHNFHRNVETPAADFTGAMAITNSAPHEFDIVRHVLGTEFRAITAMQPKRSDDRVAPVVMVLETVTDQLVTIEINNNATYGYDVRAELVGETASIAMNHVAYTRTDAGLLNATSHEADWRGRYAEAYRRQNRAFLRFVETGSFPQAGSSSWDGYAASLVAEAGVRALAGGVRTPVDMIAKPDFYLEKEAAA